jgi:GT2 family glycosyltransferase
MNKKRRILAAVLNQGSVSVGLSSALAQMGNNPDYDVEVEFFNEKPISHNRNTIVQHFLAKEDYDYLLMIDGDIVPPPSVVNLADYQKDVIGATCFMWQQGVIMPVAFNRRPEGMYQQIELEKCDGVTEIDAIGTGCIMLSRKVLEKVKAPFMNEYDQDGIKIFGLDIAFCRRAKEKGFKIYVNTDYLCDHWTKVNLKTMYAINYGLMEEINKLKEKNEDI